MPDIVAQPSLMAARHDVSGISCTTTMIYRVKFYTLRNVTHSTRAGWVARNSGHIFRRLPSKVHHIKRAFAAQLLIFGTILFTATETNTTYRGNSFEWTD